MTLRCESDWQDPDAILRRIGAELVQCRAMLHGLELAFGPHLAGPLAAGTSRALQDVDRLDQTLADLTTCLDLLAVEIDGAAKIDARNLLGAMRLDDLARRLAGRPVLPSPPDARVALF